MTHYESVHCTTLHASFILLMNLGLLACEEEEETFLIT